MNLKEIKELIDTLIEKDIAEFELEQRNEKIRIRRNLPNNGLPQLTVVGTGPALAMPSGPPAAPPVSPAEPPGAGRLEEALHIVKSPIVGTFYEAASPGAPPMVRVGDSVEAGQVLCIIEAMKLMNEIEADMAGVVEKRFVSNQQPVEYGEALFAIRKRAP